MDDLASASFVSVSVPTMVRYKRAIVCGVVRLTRANGIHINLADLLQPACTSAITAGA